MFNTNKPRFYAVDGTGENRIRQNTNISNQMYKFQLFRPLPNRLNQSVDNAFPRQPQNQQYDQISRIRYLSNLCNDLINARESYNNPVKYASFVTLSLLDNANFDLCSILPRYDKEHEELTHKLGCLIGCDSITFKVNFN